MCDTFDKWYFIDVNDLNLLILSCVSKSCFTCFYICVNCILLSVNLLTYLLIYSVSSTLMNGNGHGNGTQVCSF